MHATSRILSMNQSESNSLGSSDPGNKIKLNGRIDCLIFGYLHRSGYNKCAEALSEESQYLSSESRRIKMADGKTVISFNDRVHDKELEEIISIFIQDGKFKVTRSLLEIGEDLTNLTNRFMSLITLPNISKSENHQAIYGRQTVSRHQYYRNLAQSPFGTPVTSKFRTFTVNESPYARTQKHYQMINERAMERYTQLQSEQQINEKQQESDQPVECPTEKSSIPSEANVPYSIEQNNGQCASVEYSGRSDCGSARRKSHPPQNLNSLVRENLIEPIVEYINDKPWDSVSDIHIEDPGMFPNLDIIGKDFLATFDYENEDSFVGRDVMEENVADEPTRIRNEESIDSSRGNPQNESREKPTPIVVSLDDVVNNEVTEDETSTNAKLPEARDKDDLEPLTITTAEAHQKLSVLASTQPLLSPIAPFKIRSTKVSKIADFDKNESVLTKDKKKDKRDENIKKGVDTDMKKSSRGSSSPLSSRGSNHENSSRKREESPMVKEREKVKSSKRDKESSKRIEIATDSRKVKKRAHAESSRDDKKAKKEKNDSQKEGKKLLDASKIKEVVKEMNKECGINMNDSTESKISIAAHKGKGDSNITNKNRTQSKSSSASSKVYEPASSSSGQNKLKSSSNAINLLDSIDKQISNLDKKGLDDSGKKTPSSSSWKIPKKTSSNLLTPPPVAPSLKNYPASPIHKSSSFSNSSSSSSEKYKDVDKREKVKEKTKERNSELCEGEDREDTLKFFNAKMNVIRLTAKLVNCDSQYSLLQKEIVSEERKKKKRDYDDGRNSRAEEDFVVNTNPKAVKYAPQKVTTFKNISNMSNNSSFSENDEDMDDNDDNMSERANDNDYGIDDDSRTEDYVVSTDYYDTPCSSKRTKYTTDIDLDKAENVLDKLHGYDSD